MRRRGGGVLGGSICLNFVVTPLYMGAAYEQVAALVLPALLPFNVFKALANSIVAIVSYRKLASLLEDQEGNPLASGRERL